MDYCQLPIGCPVPPERINFSNRAGGSWIMFSSDTTVPVPAGA